jgi:hypothetical protein
MQAAGKRQDTGQRTAGPVPLTIPTNLSLENLILENPILKNLVLKNLVLKNQDDWFAAQPK